MATPMAIETSTDALLQRSPTVKQTQNEVNTMGKMTVLRKDKSQIDFW